MRVLLLFLLLLPLGSEALTRRIAVVVGQNAGSSAQPPLRYAEVDAGKLADTLVEVGGVRPEDLFLLQGRKRAEIEKTLRTVGERVSLWQRSADTRVVVLFYFSGHSDGVALEIGRERLELEALKGLLEATGADLRLGIVDSCYSGALLAQKGGSPVPEVQVRLADELKTRGQAFLTSSASDERALESRALAGSFFTHHLVSGLRGAADRSADGLVSLSELYEHVYEHTVSATSATLLGAQHPSFSVQLSGQGELVLSELSRAPASLQVPGDIEHLLLTQMTSGRVVAEVGPGSARTLALSAGRYLVKATRQGETRGGRLQLDSKKSARLEWASLSKTESSVQAKGAEAAEARAFRLGLGGGVEAGASPKARLLSAARLSFEQADLFALRLGLGRGEVEGSHAESIASLSLLWMREWPLLGSVSGRLQAGAVLGLVHQKAIDGWTGSSAFGGAELGAGLLWTFFEPLSLSLELSLPAGLVRRDDALTVLLLPSAGLSLFWSF